MPRQNQPELDPRLAQLYGLNQLNQQQEQGDVENTALMVKMLASLYDLSAAPQKQANENTLAQAHARYYDAETEGQVGERGANTTARNAMALRAMAEAGLPREAIEAQARSFGFMVPEPVKPMKPFDEGKTLPPTTQSPVTLPTKDPLALLTSGALSSGSMPEWLKKAVQFGTSGAVKP